MTKQEVREKLSEYSNGGNAYLVFDHLLDKKVEEVKISQSELAKELHKTRPAIQSSLELLEKIGIIEFGYGKIKIIKEIIWEEGQKQNRN